MMMYATPVYTYPQATYPQASMMPPPMMAVNVISPHMIQPLSTVPISLNQEKELQVTVARLAPEMPPAVEKRQGRQVSVVLIRDVPVYVSLSDLKKTVEAHFQGVRVVRMLPVWNKGVTLVELSERVTIPSWQVPLGEMGLLMEASDKPSVKSHQPSSAVNARFFFLDPTRDFSGTPEEHKAYRDLQGTWNLHKDVPRHGKRMSEYLKLAMMLPVRAWTHMFAPLFPNCMTEQLHTWDRRMYTQLFFAFRCTSPARQAVQETDGTVLKMGNLRIVVRLHCIDRNSITNAPLVANPGFDINPSLVEPNSNRDDIDDTVPQLLEENCDEDYPCPFEGQLH
eukprot:Hpha_TRINITY_DN13232_c0_g1::TRINITY_DN13232_c0_g1_i1::g.155109::m.155109